MLFLPRLHANDGHVLLNIAAFVGLVPVNTSQSIGSVTRADDIPGVTSNANQAAAHCDAVQAFISDSNDGLISDDVSEHSLTSGCPVSVGESQPNDVHAQSDFDNGKY